MIVLAASSMALPGELAAAGATICLVTNDTRSLRHVWREVPQFDDEVVEAMSLTWLFGTYRFGNPT